MTHYGRVSVIDDILEAETTIVVQGGAKQPRASISSSILATPES